MNLKDLPPHIQAGVLETIVEQVGAGFNRAYYEQLAGDWLWLYEAGVDAGKEAKKKARAK